MATFAVEKSNVVARRLLTRVKSPSGDI